MSLDPRVGVEEQHEFARGYIQRLVHSASETAIIAVLDQLRRRQRGHGACGRAIGRGVVHK